MMFFVDQLPFDYLAWLNPPDSGATEDEPAHNISGSVQHLFALQL